MSRFHVAGEEDIRNGRTSDIYFFRTLETLEQEGKVQTCVLSELAVIR